VGERLDARMRTARCGTGRSRAGERGRQDSQIQAWALPDRIVLWTTAFTLAATGVLSLFTG